MPKKRSEPRGGSAVIPLPPEMQMNTGRRLRVVRKLARASQEAVAAVLGVGQYDLSRWESGARFPDVEPMVRFAFRFKVSLDFLYLGRRDGVHPALLALILAAAPELVAAEPPGTDPDKGRLLASYKAAIEQ